MPDVVTFGEAMIRLSPPHFQRLEQATTLDVQVGGGELNVAVGVSRLGLKSAWVSRLPRNPLGRLMENRVRQAGVDTSVIALWLGHAGVRSTDAYVHADITIKERALSLTTPAAVKPGRYRPTDKMLAFLERL